MNTTRMNNSIEVSLYCRVHSTGVLLISERLTQACFLWQGTLSGGMTGMFPGTLQAIPACNAPKPVVA